MTRPPRAISVPRPSIAILAALAVALTCLIAVSAPAEAAPQRKVSLKTSATTVYVGSKVSLSGKVTRTKKRIKVRVQKQTGKKWRTVRTVRTKRTGTYKLSITLTAAGRTKFRVLAPKTGRLRAKASRTRAITARPRPKATPAPKPPAPQPRTTLISRSPSGAGADGGSGFPAVSADGTWTAYVSDSSNLVTGATQAAGDVYATNNTTGATVRVSRPPSGGYGSGRSEAPSISADGRWIAYRSRAMEMAAGGRGPDHFQVFLWDRENPDATQLISSKQLGWSSSHESGVPSISDDGNRVVWSTSATNLVDDDTQSRSNAFLWTRGEGVTLLTRAAGGGSADGDSVNPVISGNGRFVAFTSAATNLMATESSSTPSAYVIDLSAATTRPILVSRAATGGQPDGESAAESLSDDGRFITFSSSADDISAGHTGGHHDVFVWDRLAPSTAAVLVSRRMGGGAADERSRHGDISGDGRYVSYVSWASDIAPGDENGASDIFLWDRTSPAAASSLISAGAAGMAGNQQSGWYARTSRNGRHIVYTSYATDLVSGDGNRREDVFLWDRLR
ncbi:PD40 domain-containing protein [Aeromicrobium senzhongii]|uniref:PD40 domain-containing protein n=1 Tax=Aeromicrobium senzhongii TaxID=2663859 RepID=A0ABX6T2E5_9ACTN|nr:PD40 domain-containing protein [Aeromicrobium senzhongii]MTB87294.1 hypothetical protein [Aeromicrobium senzhongii]QNL95640.1 PD40 domain-containing protein [Aeromicrobium senzhongii]